MNIIKKIKSLFQKPMLLTNELTEIESKVYELKLELMKTEEHAERLKTQIGILTSPDIE